MKPLPNPHGAGGQPRSSIRVALPPSGAFEVFGDTRQEVLPVGNLSTVFCVHAARTTCGAAVTQRDRAMSPEIC